MNDASHPRRDRSNSGPSSGTGTAVRDSGTAAGLSVVLCVLLAVGAASGNAGMSSGGMSGGGMSGGGMPGGGMSGGAFGSAVPDAVAAVVAVLIGIAVVTSAGLAVMSRAGRWSGPADRVTLGRTVLIGGCATLAVLILAGALPPRPWWLAVLVVPALLLDAVDGYVARRTRTASAAGARLDMEMDAALLMVLSVIAVVSIGWWVPAIGGMRYAFVLAGRVRPQLTKPLAFSQFRRVIAAVEGITLAVALSPVCPLPVARISVAVALALLVVSFGKDVITLERAHLTRRVSHLTGGDQVGR